MPGGLKLTKGFAPNFSSSEPAPATPSSSSSIPLIPSSRDKLEDTIRLNGKLLHRWNNKGFYYEARIIKEIKNKDGVVLKYKLHYNNWASSYDTKLTREEILETCRVYTPEEAEKAAEEVAAAQKNLFGGGSKSRKSKGSRTTLSSVREVSSETSSSKRVRSSTYDLVIKHENPIQISPKFEQLSNRECVFPPRFALDKAYEMYTEKLKTEQKSPYPRKSVEETIDSFKLIQDDCTAHFFECLTKNEIPEYIKVLNKKRAILGLLELDVKDYLDCESDDDDDTEDENKIPASEVTLPVHENFDFLHFIRFVKLYNEKTEENQLGLRIYRPLFDDFLSFMDDNITMEMYDDEMQ